MSEPRVYIVMDPCQDFEDRLTIFGEFSSIRDAKYWGESIRRNPGGHYRYEDDLRCVAIEEWAGTARLAVFEYSLAKPVWHQIAGAS